MPPFNAKFHAIFASYLSIFTGTTSVVLAIFAGNAEISMSMIGMALIGITDVAASIMVLAVYIPISFASTNWHGGFTQKRQEARYSLAIGVIMVMLGIFLFVDSIVDLAKGGSENEHLTVSNERLAMVTAIFGTVTSLVLAVYKFVIAERLDSSVVFVDALTSFCTGLVSAAGLVIALNPQFAWWADGFVGIFIAVYALYSGFYTVLSARYALLEVAQDEGSGEHLKQLVHQFHSSYSYQQESVTKGTGRAAANSYPGTRQFEDPLDYDDEYEVVFESTSYRLPTFHSFFSAMSPLSALGVQSVQTRGVPANPLFPHSYSSIPSNSADSDEDEADLTFEA